MRRVRCPDCAAVCLLLGASRRCRQRGHAAPRYDTSRIVSIGGSVTEILYALDVAQKIVAVDTTSL